MLKPMDHPKPIQNPVDVNPTKPDPNASDAGQPAGQPGAGESYENIYEAPPV